MSEGVLAAWLLFSTLIVGGTIGVGAFLVHLVQWMARALRGNDPGDPWENEFSLKVGIACFVVAGIVWLAIIGREMMAGGSP